MVEFLWYHRAQFLYFSHEFIELQCQKRGESMNSQITSSSHFPGHLFRTWTLSWAMSVFYISLLGRFLFRLWRVFCWVLAFLAGHSKSFFSLKLLLEEMLACECIYGPPSTYIDVDKKVKVFNFFAHSISHIIIFKSQFLTPPL